MAEAKFVNETQSTLSGLAAAVAAVRDLAPERRPRIGVVLGSGLGAWADRLSDVKRIPYGAIPSMPSTSVAGHAGALCLGTVGTAEVACLQGRVHAYEGHPTHVVVQGARLLAALGCDAVLLTNAAGGIHAALRPGDLMLITDHLNLSGRNPLVGWATDKSPFADLTAAYCPRLGSLARAAAEAARIRLREGVYAGLLGPSYETPAEVRMLRTLGADAVGMSTVLETIALNHWGVRVGAVSCITNIAAGLGPAALSHDDVQQTAQAARATFETLLEKWIERVAEDLA